MPSVAASRFAGGRRGHRAVRLFVAVWPSEEICRALEMLPRLEAPGLRWARSGQWHVTLRFLGDCDPDEAVAALAGLAARSAVAELGPATRLLGGRIVIVPVAGLDDLATMVVAGTAGLGEPPEDRVFKGHLTLAKSKGPVPPGAVGMPIGASFPVDDVCLVRSRTLSESASYETLERFSLG